MFRGQKNQIYSDPKFIADGNKAMSRNFPFLIHASQPAKNHVVHKALHICFFRPWDAFLSIFH